MLYQKFLAALAQGREVGGNMHLDLLADAVKVVEMAKTLDASLAYYTDELEAMLNEPDFALSPLLTNQFAQLLGEAHFLTICREKGVELTRIPVQSVKTPDFETVNVSPKMHFEVKTLSVVDGEAGIGESLKAAAAANVRLEAQIANGATIATAEHVVAPYGNKPYTEDGTISAIINTLIKKATQNFKPDQFIRDNTFLVLNLSIIPPSDTKPAVLRPSYPDDHPFPTCVTGDLWTMAFGRPGMLVQSAPEFEGKPAVEGILQKSGMLIGPKNARIAGIIFMVHPWGKPAQLWGLVRAADKEKWDDDFDSTITPSGGLSVAFENLVGSNWNDSDDTNGWALGDEKA